MKDIRQSLQFTRFMFDLGWQVKKIDSSFIYLRKFPLIGYFAKIPRIKPPLSFSDIKMLIQNEDIFRLKISPDVIDLDKRSNIYRQQFQNNKFRIDLNPFNPTTDIQIDLSQSKNTIFSKFTSAKRRAVRRALKNVIKVKDSDDIDAFIGIRKKQYSPIGFLVISEMKKLWQNFYPKNAALLLAFSKAGEPLAGILLLFYNNVAYYWYASSLKIGKKLFAPTLLVWEALKFSKNRGCKIFAFEGIYDDRFPKAAQSWRGFTKFKEGFGGKKVVYMENFVI